MQRTVDKDKRIEELVLLSQKLGGVTIVEKGEIDVITNGEIGNNNNNNNNTNLYTGLTLHRYCCYQCMS